MRAALFALSLTLSLLACACASLTRPPDTGRPAAGPPYPVILGASEERRDKALAAWSAILSGQGASTSPPAPELQPVTATLRALPTNVAATLRLPKVGGERAGQQPTEEETRESLRRFIASAAPLLGVLPGDLSLIEHADNQDGTKRARYRQRPFLYPLRGGYGALEIVFTPDHRITQISSTAIPDAARLELALTAVRTQSTLLTPQAATARLVGRSVTYTDAAGRSQTTDIPAATETTARELVIYPVRRADDPTSLALHLAWEVTTAGPVPLVVYVDAVNGETIAAMHAAAAAIDNPAVASPGGSRAPKGASEAETPEEQD